MCIADHKRVICNLYDILCKNTPSLSVNTAFGTQSVYLPDIYANIIQVYIPMYNMHYIDREELIDAVTTCLAELPRSQKVKISHYSG